MTTGPGIPPPDLYQVLGVNPARFRLLVKDWLAGLPASFLGDRRERPW